MQTLKKGLTCVVLFLGNLMSIRHEKVGPAPNVETIRACADALILQSNYFNSLKDTAIDCGIQFNTCNTVSLQC